MNENNKSEEDFENYFMEDNDHNNIYEEMIEEAINKSNIKINEKKLKKNY